MPPMAEAILRDTDFPDEPRIVEQHYCDARGRALLDIFVDGRICVLGEMTAYDTAFASRMTLFLYSAIASRPSRGSSYNVQPGKGGAGSAKGIDGADGAMTFDAGGVPYVTFEPANRGGGVLLRGVHDPATRPRAIAAALADWLKLSFAVERERTKSKTRAAVRTPAPTGHK